MNLIFFSAGIVGLTSVIIGASTDHLLKESLSATGLQLVMTALHYQQLYAIVLLILGIAEWLLPQNRLRTQLRWTAGLFILGVVSFSSGLYLTAFSQPSVFSYLAPVGGALLILGWLGVIMSAIGHTRSSLAVKDKG